MNFQTPRNPRRAPSAEPRWARVSERLARADTPRRQVTQKLEQALRLSQLTALPATEAYRLITRYGLGFAATVEDLRQAGCKYPPSPPAGHARPWGGGGGDERPRRPRLFVDPI